MSCVDQTRAPASLTPSFRLGALGLLALVGAVFHAVPGFAFVRWDDDINVTQNPLLTAPWSWSLVGQLLDGDQALRFKPLHWLCFRVLHAGFGFEPAAWHAFGLALHAAAAVLFYAVLRRVFALTAWGGNNPAAGGWAALAGAAWWAVHPLRAEVVAWVTASPYALTAVLLLASFLCYLKAAEKTGRAARWLGASWALAVLAYASYPVGLTYGLWLMAVDRWLLPPAGADGGAKRVRIDWAWWGKHAAFLAPAVLALGVTVWSRFTAPGVFTAAPDVAAVGLLPRVTMALASLGYFFQVLVWPVNLTPNLAPLGANGAAALQVAAYAVIAAVALAVLAWRRRRQPRWALVGLGLAGLALPCLGWTERPTWPVDRYSYLVHLVLVGGVVGGLWGWAGAQKPRRLAVGAGVIVVGLLWAVAAGRQATIWRDSPALFAHMERHPQFADNPRQQGHIYVLWGRYEATLGHRERAAELFNAAQGVYFSAIKGAVARANYGEALALSTHLAHFFTLTPVMRRERGAWLLQLGRKEEARAELRAVAPELAGDARLAELLANAEEKS